MKHGLITSHPSEISVSKMEIEPAQYDLVLLRAAWNTARIEWGWDLGDNPLTLIRFPKSNPPRERRLKQGEYEKLMAACS